jgi:hypothetical protein
MINKEEYQFLCRQHDKVLLHKDVTEGLVANVGLHIIREHPDFLRSYQYLFQSSRFIRLGVNFLSFFRFTAITVVRVIYSIFNKNNWHCEKVKEKSDVLFVSHLINKKILKQENDFYFHDMPKNLNDMGVTSKIALINHIKIKPHSANVPILDNNFSYIVLSPVLDFLTEIKIYLQQLKSLGLLMRIIKAVGMSDQLIGKLLVYQLSSDTANTLRISKQIAMLVNVTQARILFVTYEGHAWERLVFCEARKINPNILCIGYQHAAISENQHAIKRLLHPCYNPDVIFTAGRVSELQLRPIADMSTISIKCLGSSKSSQSVIKSESDVSVCLVVPEGIVSECLLLFEFSFLCAQCMPEYQFVWRLHPLLSFSILSKRSKIFKHLPSNVCLSDLSLESDIKRCDSVLYRGSTAVVEGIRAGLRPIYLARDVELSIDPIYDYILGKAIVSTVAEFKRAAKVSLNESEKLALSEYAQKFYMPIDYSMLKDVCSK